MKNKLIIIGASGHGKVVTDIAIKMDKWDVIEFLDDDESINSVMSFKVIGKTIDAVKHKEHADFFVAIGNNKIREKISVQLMNLGLTMVKLVHPNATIGVDVKVGSGTVIMAGAVINSSTEIGEGCIINTNSNLDHDNTVEDYVHISPGVSVAGSVTIGKGTWLGIGSSICNNVSICSSCNIGAGAVVINDIHKSGTYVGVPVRKSD